MEPVSPSTMAEDRRETESPAAGLSALRVAQRSWAAQSVNERLKVVRRARELLAERAEALANMSAALRGRPTAEALSAEVLPLLEAHRFLEREGGGLLAPKRLGKRGRPFWLNAVTTEIRREPRGIVLVVGPGNYPLLIPGVQILQALAAGNGVAFKPAPGTGALIAAFRERWIAGGLPPALLQILPEAAGVVHEVIRAGVDFVVLTGSATVGETVLKSCAERLTPSVMELSGCDAVIVCEDADVELAAKALAFGLRINAGATCIAPRRVYVARRIAERLEAHLTREVQRTEEFPAPDHLVEQCQRLLADAGQRNAAVLTGGLREGVIMLPLVISGGAGCRAMPDEEVFAPVLILTFVETVDEAIALARSSAYALGASIFSRDEKSALRLAERLNAGVVSINDLIVPTADPRIPFGGRGRSGFGVTRGEEGLLTMTIPKVITSTRGRSRPHFAAVGDNETELFAGYIAAAHSGDWKQYGKGVRRLWRALKSFGLSKRQERSHDSSHDK